MSEALPGNTPEIARPTPPRIYVASLSDYNAGRLHGVWIDVTEDIDAIDEQIANMLKRSPEPGAEEYAIHDFDGFGPLSLGEYDSIERIAEIGEGMSVHGMAFAHWANHLGSNQWEQLHRFEECFQGEWFSIEEYAQQLLDDQGIDTEELGPEWLQPYINFDIERFASDMALDFEVSESDAGVFIFQL